MSTQTLDPIAESVAKIEASGLSFKFGMKQQLEKDLKRELQAVNGGYRNGAGIKVDLDSYISARLESGLYLKSKPSVKETYQSIFKSRTGEVKNAHAKFSEQYLRKAIRLEGFVFNPGMEEKAIELLKSNFLPEDDDEKGLTFRMISDTQIGSLPSTNNFTLSELLNQTGLERHVDQEASRIFRLQHKATLRQTAAQMAEAGSRPAVIEKLVIELENFEKRSLKTNKKLPYISGQAITDEFTKRYSLDTQDRSMVQSKTRLSVAALNDLSPLRSAVAKIEVNNEASTYDEFKSLNA